MGGSELCPSRGHFVTSSLVSHKQPYSITVLQWSVTLSKSYLASYIALVAWFLLVEKNGKTSMEYISLFSNALCPLNPPFECSTYGIVYGLVTLWLIILL